MAIDLGGFGRSQAQISGMPETRPNTAGKELSGVAKQLQRELDIEQNKANQAQDELDRGRMAVEMAKYGNDLDSINTEVFEGIKTGKYKPEEATNEFNRMAKERREMMLMGADDRIKQHLSGGLELIQIKAQSGVMRAQTGYVQKGFADEINSAGEQFSRMAVRDPNAAVAQFSMVLDRLAPQAGLDPAQIGKARQSFAESAYFDSRASFINNTDSAGALKAERQKLASPDYLPDLTPHKRLALQDAADTKMRSIEANQRAAAAEARQAVESQARTMIGLLDSGVSLSPEVWGSAYKLTTQDGPVGEAVKAGIERYKVAQRINDLPIQGQSALVAELGDAVTKASTPEAAAAKRSEYRRAAEIYSDNLKTISSEPWKQFEAVTGNVVPPINMGGDILGQLSQRAAIQRKASARIGVNPGLFKDEEIKQFTQLLDQMPTNKQVELFQGIAAASEDKGRSTFAAMKKADPIYSHIALAASENYRTTLGTLTADVLARGNKILKDKTSGDKLGLAGFNLQAMELRFDKETNGMFRNATEQRTQLLDLTRAAYARYSEQAGDFSGEFNKNRFNQALNVASGGITTINGHNTIKPYGMPDDKFQAKTKEALSFISNDFSQERRSAIIGKSRLEPAPEPNTYNIYLDGAMMMQNNLPIKLQIK